MNNRESLSYPVYLRDVILGFRGGCTGNAQGRRYLASYHAQIEMLQALMSKGVRRIQEIITWIFKDGNRQSLQLLRKPAAKYFRFGQRPICPEAFKQRCT
jgi:hypothetical protein